jgi:prephenate dehydrogenase
MTDQRDEFTEAMWEHMQLVNQKATQKIRELRDEIKALRAELKDRDPQLWEMAEEICALQLRLASAKGPNEGS